MATRRSWPAISFAAYALGLAIIGSPRVASAQSDPLDVWVLDVGQGSCIVVDCPDNDLPIIIDCGRTDESVLNGEVDVPGWIDAQLSALGDARVLVSHGDRDHYNLLSDIDPDNVSSIAIGGAFDDYSGDRGRFHDWVDEAIAAEPRTFAPQASRASLVRCGEARVDLLAVNATRGATKNGDSMVVALSYGSTTIVLTGDAEGVTEDLALTSMRRWSGRYPNQRNILIGSHHGADTHESNGQDWIDAWRPDVAIFSATPRSFGHPRCAAVSRFVSAMDVERGASRITCGVPWDYTVRRTVRRGILTTHDNGFIRLRITPSRLDIQCQRVTSACSRALPASVTPGSASIAASEMDQAFAAAATAPFVAAAASAPVSEARAGDSDNDPFAQFDLGVAEVRPNQPLEAWAPIATTPIRLRPQSVDVADGQSLDALLLSRGVRPDVYSRALVRAINPGLDASFRLRAGQTLTLFELSGQSPDVLVALQPYQAERQSASSALAELTQQWRERAELFPARERQSIEASLRQIYSSQQASVLTDLSQILSVTRLLEERASTNDDGGDFASLASESRRLPRELAAAAADRGAQLLVQINPAGAPRAGVCQIVWSVAGFSDFIGSRAVHDYPASGSIPVDASSLEVWITRAGQPISSRVRINKDDLLRRQPYGLTITVTGTCDP